MAKYEQKRPKMVTKWQKITKNGIISPKKIKNGHNSTNIAIKWPKTIKYRQKWPNMNKKDQKWP